ncbi:MAG: broad specificity phosphatase PhoE [Arenicella sp.]|jgi:broad specificity phosphatase PhoE
MKTIYLIRHGQTEFNKLKLVQGSGIDSNLNEVGWLQSEAFFGKYQSVSFDKTYTSKLKRTHQTVRRFVEQGVDWEQLVGLNEISWGEKEGRIITAADDNRYFEMLNAWRTGDWDWKEVGGESPLEVQARQITAWNHIMSQTEESTVLVCMHGRAIRILLCYLLDVSLSEMDDFSHGNTCLYLLEFDGKKYHLKKTNDQSHLDGIELEISDRKTELK